MFGKIYKHALLAVVILIAVIRVDETVEYSPWCSRQVPAQLTALLPRPAPCKYYRKNSNRRLYLILLLLLAGDVELNPGPSHMENITAGDTSLETRNGRSDTAEAICALCGMTSESLMLRSRTIAGTIINCMVPDCSNFVHRRCKEDGNVDTLAEWTCNNHSNINDGHQAQHMSSSHPLAPTDDTPVQLHHAAPESIPGPSFMSVNLMDVMEAVRLTHLKIDKVSNDLEEMKQVFQTLLHQDDRRPNPSLVLSGPVSQDRQIVAEAQRQDADKTTSSLSISKPEPEPDLLIIGDSNVRRLETSNCRTNITFRSTSGATTEQLGRELHKTVEESAAPKVVFHIGTNDLAEKGSEVIASNIMKLAQQTKSHPGIQHVYVCSVTPRKDLGSFIFSRSESVNNRLHSLCKGTAGVNFIDLRQQLDRCPFTGLVRDALHYNNAGASQVLKKITDSVGITFLA